MTRRLLSVLLAVLATLTISSGLAPAAWARYDTPVEDYAAYQPQTTCKRTARPGTVELARWINRRFDGGTARATLRSCKGSSTSEHKDGRAIDWTMDATKRSHRLIVKELLRVLRAPDADGNEDMLARRMGVMYLIWNDHIYSAWRSFDAEDYLNSGCKRVSRCSTTLRHRDHVHLSLGWPGARARTSWYLARAAG